MRLFGASIQLFDLAQKASFTGLSWQNFTLVIALSQILLFQKQQPNIHLSIWVDVKCYKFQLQNIGIVPPDKCQFLYYPHLYIFFFLYVKVK